MNRRIPPTPVELTKIVDRIARAAMPIRRRLLLIVLLDFASDIGPEHPDHAVLLSIIEALRS